MYLLLWPHLDDSHIQKSNRTSQHGPGRQCKHPMIITTYHSGGLYAHPKLNCKITANNRNTKGIDWKTKLSRKDESVIRMVNNVYFYL